MAVAAGSALLVAGFLGSVHPAFDSLSHFRAHIAVATALAALVRMASGRGAGRAIAAAALAVVAVSAITVAPYLVPSGQASAATARTYRMVQLNAQARPGTAAMLSAFAPDIVTLQEAPDSFQTNRTLMATFPHRIFCARGTYRQRGIALLSRHPFAEPPQCDEWAPHVGAAVLIDGQRVEVASQHLFWPWPYGQTTDLPILAARLRTMRSPKIIGGDFNAVPWSTTVRRIASMSGTTPVAGIGPTWLLNGLNLALRPYLGLPIDNVLTAGIDVVRVERLGPAGSDHLPVMIEFTLGGSSID